MKQTGRQEEALPGPRLKADMETIFAGQEPGALL